MGAQGSPGTAGAPAVRLLGSADVREIAGRLGVRPSKRLGQNFVVEQGTVRKIAALAAVGPDDVVLEVGPGLGSLTLALLGGVVGAMMSGGLAIWGRQIFAWQGGTGEVLDTASAYSRASAS